MSKDRIVWKKEPEADDYSGTLNFLSLIFPAPKCEKTLGDLRSEATIDRAAKDLLRASNLLLAKSPVMLPIPGTRSIEHLEDNVLAAALRLAPEDFDDLG